MEVKINQSNQSHLEVLLADFYSRGFFTKPGREGFAVVGHSILARFRIDSLLRIRFLAPSLSHFPSISTSTSTLVATLSWLFWLC